MSAVLRAAGGRCAGLRTLVIAVAGVLLLGACSASESRTDPSPSSTASSSASASSFSAPSSGAPSSRPVSPPATTPSSAPSTSSPRVPPVVTPEGMWWGVDSTTPISDESLANVRGWYRGARPQFWGRYLGGHFAVSKKELAYARAHDIYVYLIAPDANCSGCGGGDACGNDRTATQAAADARDVLAEARRLGLPERTVLYKDIEQVSSCRAEPSPEFLLSWQHTLAGSGYRTGFYGNVHQQHFDFPRAYCAAVAKSTAFRDEVLLDMNEDEPLIGAPRGTTGPHNAPKFAPKTPSCAPPAATVIWQYGESLTSANYTDIDLAKPDVVGMLAPDGGVT